MHNALIMHVAHTAQRKIRGHLPTICPPTIEYDTYLSAILLPMSTWGGAPGAHKPPTASPWVPTTPKRPRPDTEEFFMTPSILENWQLPGHPDQRISPASLIHVSSQSQFSLGLQSHIAAAVASRKAEIKTTGDKVLELVSLASQKVTNWEGKGLLSRSSARVEGHPSHGF